MFPELDALGRIRDAMDEKEINMRKFGPKPKIELSDIRIPCPACHELFVEGDYTTLVALGPGDDEDARKRRDEGRPYNAVAIEVHWDCAKRSDE